MLLDERKKRILEAVIEEYNATAEPVGSTKIATDYDLGFSPATIRNEMANLEELGYLEQPHVSAGRIPSSSGYRLYIDTIMKEKTLTAKEKQVIDEILKNDIIKFETLIKEASNIISRLTNYTSIAIGPQMDNCTVEEIKLVKLGQDRLMIVILADNGIIKESIIKYDGTLPEENIEIFNNYLNHKLKGMNFNQIYENINSYVEDELYNISTNIIPLVVELNNLLIDKNVEVYMDGTKNLLELPELKQENTLKNFLNIIETQDALKELLRSGYDGNINVYIGQENVFDDFKDFTIITYKQKINDKEIGTIGLIGPKRMDYKKVIPVIKYVGEALQEKIKGGGNFDDGNKGNNGDSGNNQEARDTSDE
ncbi:MAG: heat-inducible transcription repressor HrcA [Clostridia bacterium]|nr:heat-inducible transcription repressor HrcA [Clostridia bacterium]